jgi:hypothetical protein
MGVARPLLKEAHLCAAIRSIIKERRIIMRDECGNCGSTNLESPDNDLWHYMRNCKNCGARTRFNSKGKVVWVKRGGKSTASKLDVEGGLCHSHWRENLRFEDPDKLPTVRPLYHPLVGEPDDPMRPSALPKDLRSKSDPMRPSALPEDLRSTFNPMWPRYIDQSPWKK